MQHDKPTRSEQSRINGAKSHGPVTAEGKARSAINHTSHGMHSSRTVLETESVEYFQLLAALYHGIFQPQDQFETDLVENMINARWKIRRLEDAHTAELNLSIYEQNAENEEKYGNIDFRFRAALAYRASGKYLDTLEKHLERMNRLFLRSFRALGAYRKNAPLPTPEELRGLEASVPSNHAPQPQPAPAESQNERIEPSSPNPFQKIAIIIILLLTSIAHFAAPTIPAPPEKVIYPHAST
jgi:hypothetical protein